MGSEGGEVDPWEVLFVGADVKGREKDGEGKRKLEMLSKRLGRVGILVILPVKVVSDWETE